MAYVSQEDLIIYVDGITQFNAGEDCNFRIIVYKDYLDTQLTLENVDAITVTIFDDVGRRVLSYTYPNIPGKTLPLSIGGTGTSTEKGFIEFIIAGTDSQQFVPNDVYATVSFVWTDYYPAPKTITTPKIKIGDVSGATGSQPQLPNDVIGERGPKGEPGSGGAGGSIIPGPKGDKGDAGQKGAEGEKGSEGSGGDVAGPKGEKGDIGPTGIASTIEGPTGVKGEIGPQGPSGPTGPKGEAGVGQKGEAGVGQKGEAGVGQKGDEGIQGPQGPAGVGQKGEAGVGQKGEAGDEGIQGPQGPAGVGQKGEAGVKGEPGTGGSGSSSGVTAYLCKVEFDINNKATTTGLFVDPNSNGKYNTSGASYTRDISGSQYNGLFSFNETSAPISVIAYGFDNAGGAGSTPRYAITHLDFGGTNNQYEIIGITPSSEGGGVIDTDLFTSFSNAQIKIDLNNTYFELLSRPGFPAASLGHIYFVFTFN